MHSNITGFRKALTVVVMMTVGSFSSLLTNAAMAQVAPKLAGDVSVRGSVMLNGVTASNGATVFADGRIRTGSNSGATINLGKLGQVELEADSELVLRLEQNLIGGNLRAGRATVTAPKGVSVNILTADGIATAEGKDASVLTVDISCGNIRVMSIRNEAKVTAGSRVEIVPAGQEVSVGTPQDAARCARIAQAPKGGGAAGGIGALSGGALAALILLGVGGAVVGIVAATQGDNAVSNGTNLLSQFRP
jgi:hypothetical protein